MPFRLTGQLLELYRTNEVIRRTSGTVYLIFRLNDDDDSVESMWDAPFERGQVTTVERGHQRFAFVEKYQTESTRSIQPLDDKGKQIQGRAGRPGGQTYAPAEMQGGGHAEEFFLRRMLQLANTRNIPNTVELYISRIPCAIMSPMWRCQFGGNLITLPEGCGAKLLQVVRHTQASTQWYIAYDESYNRPDMQASCLAHITRINNEPNAEAGHISRFLN